MDPIALRSVASVRTGRSPAGQSAINTAAGLLVMAVALVAPLPFGSVHPISWAFFAMLLGGAGLAYVMALARIGGVLRFPLAAIGPGIGLFLATCLFLVVQMLPIAWLLPPGLLGAEAAPGETISIAGDATMLMLMRQLGYGVFFFLALQSMVNDGRNRLMGRAMLIGIAFYAVGAIFALQAGDTLLGLPKTAYQGSATGPFVNRNSFATFLAFGAMLALAQLCRHVVAQVERHRNDGMVPGGMSSIMLHAMLYLLLVSTVIATQSRMGLMATLLGSASIVTVALLRATASRMAALGIVGAMAAALASGLVLFGDALMDRLGDSEAAAMQRSDLYAQVWELVLQRPFLGFGGGAFELAFPRVHQEPVSFHYVWDKAHSTYLTLWSELGLVVGSLPVLALFALAAVLVRGLLRRPRNWAAPTAALGALMVAATHSLVDFSLEIEANMFVLLLIVASGLAAVASETPRARRDLPDSLHTL
ncbi:O-antigen ligase family protein [Devosia sp.]|uniref:O-antigen ligase family protein n=1 Tax=Devosia sp. TaxID=1871048 RepID=UPI002AFDDBA7|nr:O-antigen ligase family protein [Devosia sp.]